MYIHMCTCIHVYMYACIHACMHACMHTYIHTYIYICREALPDIEHRGYRVYIQRVLAPHGA